MDDWQLLTEYRLRRSQAAFGELVRRHLPLVLGVCRRRLRDGSLAEDVAQAVFLLLSRRPPTRRDGAELTGWLFKTAQYACGNAMRSRHSRQRHESAVAAGRSEFASPRPIGDAEVMLDDALAALSPADRDVVLLRYYRGLDVAQVAERLQIPHTATAKRLSRAIDRLRKFFSRNGAMLNMTLAAQQLANLARDAAPPGLAEQISAAACGQAAGSPLAVSITERMIQMIRRSQIRFASTITAAALGIGAGGAVFAWAFMGSEQPAGDEVKVNVVERVEQKVAAPVDSRSPVEILRSFAKATRSGDVAAMRAVVYVTNNTEKRLLESACAFAESAQALRSAVARKFGDEVAKRLAQQNLSPLDNFTQMIEQLVDKVEPTIEGDFATITGPGMGPDAFILERVNGSWKISAPRMTETWDAQMTEQRLGTLVGAADGVSRLAQEVSDDKFANVEEFSAAVNEMFGKR